MLKEYSLNINKVTTTYWSVSFQILTAFAVQKATISCVMSVRPSVCLSVRPHGTTRLPLDTFS
jgi:hypothetical protein